LVHQGIQGSFRDQAGCPFQVLAVPQLEKDLFVGIPTVFQGKEIAKRLPEKRGILPDQTLKPLCLPLFKNPLQHVFLSQWPALGEISDAAFLVPVVPAYFVIPLKHFQVAFERILPAHPDHGQFKLLPQVPMRAVEVQYDAVALQRNGRGAVFLAFAFPDIAFQVLVRGGVNDDIGYLPETAAQRLFLLPFYIRELQGNEIRQTFIAFGEIQMKQRRWEGHPVVFMVLDAVMPVPGGALGVSLRCTKQQDCQGQNPVPVKACRFVFHNFWAIVPANV